MVWTKAQREERKGTGRSWGHHLPDACGLAGGAETDVVVKEAWVT